MYKLNIVILVTLVLFALFHFFMKDADDAKISALNSEINIYKAKVDSIEHDNTIISNNIVILKDSLITYKNLLLLYNDSLIIIKKYYETQANNVMLLNDSTSYVFFKEYIECNAERFGISTN